MTVKEFKIQYALGSLPFQMKLNLAKNLNTPKKILSILSKNKYWYIRFWVAMNLNTPKEILTILLRDKDQTVSSRADIRLNGTKTIYKNVRKSLHK